jgi:hypothetical protein
MASTSTLRRFRSAGLTLLVALAPGGPLPAAAPDDADDYALSTAFTYQGRLERRGAPAEGRFDLAFELFDARDGGVSLGRADRFDVPVRSGAFAADLDFGSAVRGDAPVWLEISVKGEGDGGYVALSPRTRLAGDSLGLCTVNSDVLVNGTMEIDPIGATTGMSIACCNEADLDGGGQLRLVGSLNDLLFDTNEIQARSLLQGGAFYLNPHGGNVGVGIASGAAAPLNIPSGPDVQLGEGGALVVGSPAGVSLAIDNNEIMVRNGGSTSTLHLQADGGATSFGGPVDIGYEIVQATSTSGQVSVACSPGLRVLGGGCQTDDGVTTPDLLSGSFPFGDSSWVCVNDDSDDSTIRVYAICARVQ